MVPSDPCLYVFVMLSCFNLNNYKRNLSKCVALSYSKIHGISKYFPKHEIRIQYVEATTAYSTLGYIRAVWRI